MIHFQRTHTIDAAPEAVWAVLGRYMHIDEFAPLIKCVEALTDGEAGLGSKRRNHFENGTSLVEEVTAWEPNQSFTVELSDMAAMPLHEARSEVSIEQLARTIRDAVAPGLELRFDPTKPSGGPQGGAIRCLQTQCANIRYLFPRRPTTTFPM